MSSGQSVGLTVAVGTGLATSDDVAYGDFEFGHIAVPAGSLITTLTFSTAPSEALDNGPGTYLPAYVTTTAVTLAVAAGRTYALPSSIQGAQWFKMTGNAAGSVILSLKG